MLKRTYIAGSMVSLLGSFNIISGIPEEISRHKVLSSLVL